MLLILEIALTVTAWKRGWKALALLPIGIAFVAAFMFGMYAGANNVDLEENFVLLLAFDGFAILALIIMAAVGREVRSESAVDLAHRTEGQINGTAAGPVRRFGDPTSRAAS